MLKIEVIKFEVQDVVAASVACICTPGSCDACSGVGSMHGGFVGNDYVTCNATTHTGNK